MKRITSVLGLSLLALACKNNAEKNQKEDVVIEKQLRIPEKVWMVPDSNDYDNPESVYSFSRFRASDDFAIFWDKEYGEDPSKNENEVKTFNVDSLILEGERFFNYYVDSLQFVEKGKSTTDGTKILMYVFGGDDGTAYGAGKDSIGMLWSPAVRIHKPPYGALAHELGHSFQYLVSADGHYGFKNGGSIWEMTSQWMLWQVYPNWIEFENYHLQAFLDNTYLAFLHEENMYHSPFVLEYWSNKHGKTFIGKLWRNSKKGEDPVLTYQRITNIDQETFNDEIFDASRRFVTWDLPRIEKIASPYTNKHHTNFVKKNGWLVISEKEAPQDYGYNAVPLLIPEKGDISLEFKGILKNEAYTIQDEKNIGWRYGFLGVKANGDRVYSKKYSKFEDTIHFSVSNEFKHIWFVVSGAPKTHEIHKIDGNPENDKQYPYKIRLKNTKIISE